ncbi:MAG: prokaryotic molybdopterin-containing oxidoreductase family, iron-sulfur binding subunit [Candidatus Kentron sp. G]|nr:MAG: prokaryotic molybdopterin-containing oxidoreductase family, iron-sulfur binding subunit [Candidatus Kentron sp. G]VFN02672.1 MAG: prokaryotic molybdopterin-containing oxidoreductase family, iron-sulfur binding subunit [Candidatus Kentron sp. G]VFN04181.1 MAG: prokaryotic molybdopterin-containing oxidoreductase family, iron-sulfur binding subunit [Candidatus Kentron sp. G]
MKPSRRRFLAALGSTGAAALAGAAVGTPAWGGSTLAEALAGFFQDHYQRMTPEEIREALARIERRAKERYGVEIRCQNTPPLPGVVFGYALNISKCKGYRECVHGCVQENNQGRGSQLQYIRVLEMDRGGMDLHMLEPLLRARRTGRGQVLPAGAMHAVR